jgi:hypothetical protein
MHRTADAARFRAASAAMRAHTRHVLIAAIAPRDDALRRLLAERGAAAVDWDWLLERAQSHRVGALVAARLQHGAIDPALPRAAADRLDEIRSQAAARAEAAPRTLRALADALQRGGIPFLILKGSVLAERVYGDPLIRPFYDVDVIVPPTAVAAVEAILRASCYSMSGIWQVVGGQPVPRAEDAAAGLARRFYLRMFHNLSYSPRRGDTRRPIDLHWHIVPRGRLPALAEQLWAQTTSATVAGIEVRTLNTEAALIHQAVHALEPWFHSFRLLHLADVAWTVAAAPAQPDRLWQLAHAWGAAYHLELALRLVDTFFGPTGARTLLTGRPPSRRMRAALRLIASEEVLVDRNIADRDPWPRRAAVELAWGFAVGGLRAKIGFSLARRAVAWRWRLAQWRGAAGR